MGKTKKIAKESSGRAKTWVRALVGTLGLFLIHRFMMGIRPGNGDTQVLRSVPQVEEQMSGSGQVFYFAYASDLLEERMRKGSSKTARRIGPARASGFAFEYSIFSKVWKGGVADLVESAGSSAWGVVWDFPSKDVAALDKQKGVTGADPKYEKIDLEVDYEGRRWKAFTYVVVDSKRSRTSDGKVNRFVPSEQYRQCIVRGAKESRLPSEYIQALEAIQSNGETYKRKELGNACG